MTNKSGDLSGYFGGTDSKAPEIKIITHKEMADAGVPSKKINKRVVEKLEQNNESVSVKKSPISGKFIIVAVILLLVAVDIPIGMKIYQGYNNRNNIASSDVSQDTSATAKGPLVLPSMTPTPAPTITIVPSPTPVIDDLAQLGTQTHSECFEEACIEVEGAGTDACFVDSDCKPVASPSATTTPKTAKEVVSPDVPVAGNIKDAVIGISAGLGTILLALLMLL